MTATVPKPTHRTGPELLYMVADQIRAGHPIDEAIRRALGRDEPEARYINLVADLSTELHCEPLSKWDADLFADPTSDDPLRRADHPGAYGMRLAVWADRIGSPCLVAVALDEVANRMADSLPDFMILGAA
jgi:hypothetical protein